MKTEIIAIVDQSGSMHHLKDDADGSYQNFLNEQRDVAGEARMTLVKFSSRVNTMYMAADIKNAQPLNLEPSGNTALLDAIGQTLDSHKARIEGEKWTDLVIIMILTDGQENASKEYGPETIKRMVAEREAAGWKFIFLMSNQDAFTQARAMGSTGVYTKSHAATGQGTAESYSYASVETRNLREEKK